MTPDNVATYVADLRSVKVASGTLASLVNQLHSAVRVMAGDRSWEWLLLVAKRLARIATPSRDIRSRIVASTELHAFGLDLMATAETARSNTLFNRALDYRDGLMIALLAARPFRVRNFSAIEIGRHLIEEPSGCWLRFEGAETKNHQSLEAPFPATLVANLHRYLSVYRPVLFPNNRGVDGERSSSSALWISTQGNPMSTDSVYERITTRTTARFGRRINPHCFRHAAATTVATDDPEHVYITRCLLGHTTNAMSDRYYNYARQLDASRRYQSRIQSLRCGT